VQSPEAPHPGEVLWEVQGAQRRGSRPARPLGAYSLEEGRDNTGDVDTGTGNLLSLDKLLGTRGTQGGRLYAWCRWGRVEAFGNSFMKDRRWVCGHSGGDRHGAGFGTPGPLSLSGCQGVGLQKS